MNSKDENSTRFHIPKDNKESNEFMVILENTLQLTFTPHEFYHEKTGEIETQFVTGTLNKKTGQLQLVFFVDKLKEFANSL